MSDRGPAPAPRRGLVLGAGGVLGYSWTVGALQALAQVEGWDARTADLLVGTSAGSVMAAMLAAGVGVDSLAHHQQGVAVEGDPEIDYDYEKGTGGALPPRPRMRPGSTRLMARTALHPFRVPPMVALSSVLPQGRGSMAPVGATIDAVVAPGEWAPHPGTWIMALDYDTGARMPFGRTGSPPAGLSEAVMASCAIPGWYAPIRIGGRRYVDGGAYSSTSLDLLAPLGLDEVVVLAPMASFSFDSPSSVGARIERRLRRLVAKRLRREAAIVRAAGTRVRMLGPGPADLAAIGSNLMDPRRREQVYETSTRTSLEVLSRGLAAAG